MSEEGFPFAGAVALLVDELERLRIDEPLKYYATPYQDLHEHLKSALESYYEHRARE